MEISAAVETHPLGIGPTAALARLVVEAEPADLPPSVLHQAKRCLVDYLGVTIAGQTEASADILVSYADAVGGRAQATVIGRGKRTSGPLAALINGQAAHVLDFDDTYFSSETTLHGTAPVYSATLPIGESRRATGIDVLNAFVLGFEVAARVALALGPAHYDAGWHVTGTAGRLGAAAAAAKLLGLDEERCAMALGLAATLGEDLTGEDVEAVETRVNPYTASVTARPNPTTGLEAKFSVQHCIAAALTHRRGVRPDDFTDEVARDPLIRRLRARVRVVPDADFTKDQAAVAITLRGGRVLSADVPHARGTAARPVDDDALGEKFLSLAEPALGQRATRLLERAWVLDTAADVRGLLRLTRPPGGGGAGPAR